jgi:hypothetical protein
MNINFKKLTLISAGAVVSIFLTLYLAICSINTELSEQIRVKQLKLEEIKAESLRLSMELKKLHEKNELRKYVLYHPTNRSN